MKTTMIYSTATLFAAIVTLTGCSSEGPVITDRNLEGSDTYFESKDAGKQNLFYKPAVGYVGDPMPFFDPVAGDFKILYLQDYRPNQAVTYHPIWGVSTADGARYQSIGELIPCGGATELDAALGTGSTIYDQGVYYTFYTAHSPNPSETSGINEAVMLATSPDFKNWKKNREVIVSGSGRYSDTDFRDPFVFKGDDDRFHMLVSTRENGKGVIAEFVSDNLLDWTDNGVFMSMMWDRFYECPDLFRMDEWWYLVYSEQHDAVRRVQYFKGRTIDELRMCTANDAGIWPDNHEGFLDSRGLYAGKTASDGKNRYIWGWCATKAGADNLGNADWAGNLVAHRLIQHSDGTLTLGEVPGVVSLFSDMRSYDDFSLNSTEYRLMPRLGVENRLSFTVSVAGPDDKFGISFARGSDSKKYYSLILNPEGEGRRKINLEEEGGAGFIPNADGYVFDAPADGVYDITIVMDNSVVVVYVNDVAAYTNRVYGAAKNCWSINSYGGNISVSNVKICSK